MRLLAMTALLVVSGTFCPGMPRTHAASPVSFEANRGQTGPQVRFLARGAHSTVFLTPDEAVISSGADAVHMQFLQANANARIEGQDLQPGYSNYFIGNAPERWRQHVPTYGRVTYKNIYPDTDLVFYGNDRQMEYDFLLQPGSDPARIRLRLTGDSTLTAAGDLSVGSLIFRKPSVYQGVNSVAASYVLDGDTVRFALGAYDHRQTLVIDPVLSYSTYLGGSDDEGILGIKLDQEGNIYLSGETTSIDFPLRNPEQPVLAGNYDAFVSKFDPTGQTLIYSTYLGGGNYDHSIGLALSPSGSVYLAGLTQSVDFPTANALQPTLKGISNAFIARLDPSGSQLVFSTYLGGSDFDQASDIGLDSAGNVFIAGSASSQNFPVTPGAYSTKCDKGGLAGSCVGDAFVSKISASGSVLVYSTYLGGTGYDTAYGIAIGNGGLAYITGQTSSTDFPTKAPYQANSGGNGDAFLTVLNAAGSALLYSTYLGGSSFDTGMGIALDSDANIYLTGMTNSTNFPLANAYRSTNGGGFSDAFVTKFSSAGKLDYSTYLGGAGQDIGFRIAVDRAGEASVIGFTASLNFPTLHAIQPAYAGGNFDAFITQFGASGKVLNYSTYLGGTGDEYGYAIHSDKSGNVWVGGSTSSTDYPLVTPFQNAYAGGPFDAFLSYISK